MIHRIFYTGRLILTAFRRYLADKLNGDALLSNANFRRYWFSSILNGFGGQVSGLAVPLCAVLLLHASPSQMGMLVAAQAMPYALFALPAGVWLDRSRKLPIMLASETIQCLVLVSIPLTYWLGWLSIPWMCANAFIIGTCSLVGGGAEQIFLTQLIGRDGLIDAQSKFATTDSASRLFAPGIAGLLIQWLTAPFAVLVNAASFAISVFNLRRMRVDDPLPPPSNKHPLRDVRDGFVFIWSNPLLRALAWGAGIWHVLFYGSAALGILFATRELGMTPGMLGTAQMLGGMGVFASSQLLKPLNRRYGPGVTMLIGIGATTVGFVLGPTIPAALFGSKTVTMFAYGALTFFFDCGVMLFFMPYMALRQQVTPDDFLGRMISTMRFLTVATAPLGALAAGYLAEHLSIRSAMACIAASGVALTLAMVSSKAIRNVPVPAPVSTPAPE